MRFLLNCHHLFSANNAKIGSRNSQCLTEMKDVIAKLWKEEKHYEKLADFEQGPFIIYDKRQYKNFFKKKKKSLSK